MSPKEYKELKTKIHQNKTNDFSFLPAELNNDINIAVACFNNSKFEDTNFFNSEFYKNISLLSFWVSSHSKIDPVIEKNIKESNFSNIDLFLLTSYNANILSVVGASTFSSAQIDSLKLSNPMVITLLGDSTQDDMKKLVSSIKKYPNAYLEMSEEFKNNSLLALTAVEARPKLFYDIPAELQNNPKIAFEAIKQIPAILKECDILKEDRKFITKVFNENRKPDFLEFISSKIKEDWSFMKPFVTENFNNLRFCSSSIRNNEQIVLDLLDDSIQKNVRTNNRAINFHPSSIGSKLLNNSKFLNTVLDKVCICSTQTISDVLENAGNRVLNDKDFITRWTMENEHQKYTTHLPKIGNQLAADKDFILLLAESNYKHIQLMSPELKNDFNFCLQLFEKSNVNSFTYFSEELRANPHFIVKIMDIYEQQKSSTDLDIIIQNVLPLSLSQKMYDEHEETRSTKKTIDFLRLKVNLEDNLVDKTTKLSSLKI